ncbi:Serine/threonine-protein kinase Nek2 [Mycoblastus sanguinarius]|nr:Serine/threonine-protein kinase Nek2 [Mycoblastus sanguinarius]
MASDADPVSEPFPDVFSPRPRLVMGAFPCDYASGVDKKMINSHSSDRFSYSLSSNGVEIHDPSTGGRPDMTEEVGRPSTSQEFHTVHEVKSETKDHRSLLQRRGKNLPNLQMHFTAPRLWQISPSTTTAQSAVSITYPPIDQDYDIIKQIGFDTEGPCQLVKRRSENQLRVVKTVKNPQMAHGKPIEARVLQDIFPNRHENIIRLFHHELFGKETPLVRYYFEFCNGGDLHMLINQYMHHDSALPEFFVWKVYLQSLEALDFLHRGFDRDSDRPGIVHRDIKPENIFLRLPTSIKEYPDVVLADFGWATEAFATYEPAGTDSWLPPELPRKSPKGDIWSLGAVIHSMIHHELPLAELPEHIPATKRNCEIWESKPEARQPNRDVPDSYSRELVDLMLMALEMDHNKRKNARDLLAVLTKAVDEKFPPTYNLYEKIEYDPLADWAFDHLDQIYSPAAETEAEGTGARQFFDMLEVCELGDSTPLSGLEPF